MLDTGDTLRSSTGPAAPSRPVELEDVLSTFDADTRRTSRAAYEGFGDALSRPRQVDQRGDPPRSTRSCATSRP